MLAAFRLTRHLTMNLESDPLLRQIEKRGRTVNTTILTGLLKLMMPGYG